MGFFWLGAYEGYETDANARHRDGFVWLGAYEGYETDANARYRDGFIWLGAYEGYETDADARYRDGFVWLGAYEGYETDADARYARSGGAAAAETLLLLLRPGNAGSASEGSEDPESESADSASSYSSEGGGTAHYSGTSTSSSGNSTGLGWIGALIIIMICFAVTHDRHGAPTMGGSSSATAKGPPAHAPVVTRHKRTARPLPRRLSKPLTDALNRAKIITGHALETITVIAPSDGNWVKVCEQIYV